MSATHQLLAGLNYGHVHVIELGAAIGFLAATFHRSDRFVSYTILGLSVGIIGLQRALQTLPDVTAATYRIASMPAYFVGPMLVAFGLGVTVSRVVRARWGTEEGEATGLDERPAD